MMYGLTIVNVPLGIRSLFNDPVSRAVKIRKSSDQE